MKIELVIALILGICLMTGFAAAETVDISELDCFIDLHMHLDGSISVESARDLAALQGIEIPESDEELGDLLQVDEGCTSLDEFLTKFDFPGQLLQTKEGLSRAVVNLLDELKADGVMYAEIRFAPQKHTDRGLTQADAIRAVLDGVERSESGIPCGVILCCMRGEDTHEANMETVTLAEEFLDKGVVAVDIAGAEALFPTEDYAEEMTLAYEKSIPITIHAGEADGPESVWAALDLHASRIGHGVRSMEDPELVRTLAERHITLTLCPTSNLNTAIFSDISEYPLRELMEAGVPVTINTDDRAVCNTDIRREFQLLIDAFDLTNEEIRTLLLNSVDAAYTTDEIKETLRKRINEQL